MEQEYSKHEFYHNWDLRNKYLAQTLEHYVMRGFEPGGFVTSMLANDLFGAVAKADHWNKPAIAQIAQEIEKNVPTTAYGSYEAFQAWVNDEDERRSRYVTWKMLQGPATTAHDDDEDETPYSVFESNQYGK
jgi:hypothetical protein